MFSMIRMSKILLCTLNSKYIHSSLAIRSLKAYVESRTEFTVDIKEYTINQNNSDIMADIYGYRPDILGLSCYIWNIRPILELCADYKKVAPDTIIILGGPEVSYDAELLLTKNPFIDYVIRGEGEVTLKELIGGIYNQAALKSIAGISYRKNDQVQSNCDREYINPLDEIPFVYTDEMETLQDRVVYYESSRGCPFRCAYCLSANSRPVRRLSMTRVKSDLETMLRYQVREIKFVDRTFNCDEKRAREIMTFIIANQSQTKLHFEIDASLFSDEMLDFLATVPPNLFNFEIGVQSTFEPALQAVRRNFNWDRLSHNITRLRSFNNIHLHLDLIAGLPSETYTDFRRSFNMVYNLQPHMLQLGFLKILKGSPLHEECWRHGYIYQSQPPYQVLANHHIEYEELMTLTRIEDLLDKYYNSGDMNATIRYIGQVVYATNAFAFYEDFADYWLVHQWWGVGHKKEALYTYLQMFVEARHPDYKEIVNELLKYDYLCNHHRYSLPKGLASHNPPDINDMTYAYTRDKVFVQQNFDVLKVETPREIKKKIHMEAFKVDPITFEKKDHNLMLMFIYDPITKRANRVIEMPSQTDYGDVIKGGSGWK